MGNIESGAIHFGDGAREQTSLGSEVPVAYFLEDY